MKRSPILLAIAEILVVVLALYSPSFFQAGATDPAIFGDLSFYFSYMPLAAAQALLAVLIARKPLLGSRPEGARDLPLRLKRGDFLAGPLYAAALLCAYAALGPILSALAAPGAKGGISMAAIWLLPAFLSQLCTGYREEAFFRLYLHDRLEGLGLGKGLRILLSTALFSLGHWGNGWGGILVSACLGAILGFLYEERRSFHANALGHALYNFTLIALALLKPV